MIPKWLDALTGGASTKPDVIAAVTTYQEAADKLGVAESLYDGLRAGAAGEDQLISARILGDAKTDVRRAKNHLPLWAKIYEALP